MKGVTRIIEKNVIMARSKETYNKKELEKKKLKKRKEKDAKREERKANPGRTFEEMIAYTDEYGNIIDTPPDPTKKLVVDEKDIILGARNSDTVSNSFAHREGKVTFFNTSKGYGFIEDIRTKESIFVHVNGLVDNITENNMVTFETERGPRGLNAINVKLVK